MGSGPREPWDAQPGRRLRGALVLLPAFLFGFGYIAWGLLLTVLAPARFRRNRRKMANRWGGTLLRLFGVKVEPRGLERLRAPGPKVVVFNHQSILDLFLLTWLWDDSTTILYKREFHRIPLLGRAMRVLDLIPVDRKDREKARASIEAAAARVREKGFAVFLAPEGTRSRTGRLLPFKMGPFHLAASTGAPLVPVVFRGVWDVAPMGSWLIRPGRVGVEVLAPLDTTGWDPERVRRHAATVRALFLRYLPGEPEAAAAEAGSA